MKTYNIGIIGYGGFGRFLHHSWGNLEGAKVIAVSDASLDEGETGGVRRYKNWKDLLLNNEIDIVSIATPPSLHVELACAALRSKKHVLLEKPIAVTNEGAEEILRTQQETGMVLTVDHMLRYNPFIKALIGLSRREAFGKLRHVVVSNYAQDESLPARHWFWDKAVSGGIFIEHGVHFFDIVNALTEQQVTRVCGASHNRNEQQQDQVSATVLFDEGLIASHYHAFSGPGFFEQTTIRLTYDLARIEVEGWMPMKGTIKALVSHKDRGLLDAIPHLTIDSVTPAAELSDVSRPEGWGDTPGDAANAVRCGGITYNVDEMVTGRFETPQTKSEIYSSCLQQILYDIIAKIEDGGHSLRITPENAAEALKIAVMAEQSASGSHS